MKLLDLTLPSPEENLACDEALLSWCDARPEEEILRFWEPRDWFVVLGYANRHLREVHTSNCQRDHVPILRRCSGGGTVLQGPGTLNYSLVLRIDRDPALASITGTNAYVMEHHAATLSKLLEAKVEVQGFTDLTHGPRKFSGNAQRRRKHSLLFHGTFLLDFEIPRVTSYLQMPVRQPDYRKERSHESFLTTLNLQMDTLKYALRETWGARHSMDIWPREETRQLVLEKYGCREWNLKL